MDYRSHSATKQGLGRLLTTLVAICLPVIAATLFSGSFFRAGTLQPGQVLDATSAHAASAHSMTHSMTSTSSTSYAGTDRPSAIFDVNIQNYAFQPQNITINAGDTIRWTNLDADRHTV